MSIGKKALTISSLLISKTIKPKILAQNLSQNQRRAIILHELI